MNVFIVFAHPEPSSFNGAMKDHAVQILTEAGHHVQVSDLYAMGFNPVASANDFSVRMDPGFLKIQLEQRHAHQRGALAPDIATEQAKLLWADLVIFQFPLWWFSLPAILKGWVDRVFTMGFAYGGGKWYDNGGLNGRRAMLALTTGGPASGFSPTGINGDIDQLLFHIQHGMLYFVGLEVLPPFIVWSAAHVGPEARAQHLEAYTERLLSLERTQPIPFRPLDDYDENRQLKPGR